MVIENISIAKDHRARKQIASLVARGYRVGIICRRDEANARFRHPGCELYEYPAPPERDGKAFIALEYGYSLVAQLVLVLRALRDGGVDAIQVGQPPDIYFLPAIPARALGTRFVVDQRDLSPEIYAARFGKSDGLMTRVFRLCERASWQSADHVITVNRSLARVVAGRGRVAPERVSVVGNGPLLSAVRGREGDDSLHEGFPHLVCWLGVMGPQDRVELALHAIAHYVHHLGRRDALFAFLGDGLAAPMLRRTAAELDIEDVVRFTGWIDEQACFTYLATADLGLDTNLEPEVTPVKGLEYMAHGVPIVAFDVLETRALADGAARYVAPGDTEELARAIAQLLDAPDERGRMGRMGRERIEREFAWDRQETRYVEVYEQLLGAAAAPTTER